MYLEENFLYGGDFDQNDRPKKGLDFTGSWSGKFLRYCTIEIKKRVYFVLVLFHFGHGNYDEK